jgi:hypothetical protein
LTNTGRAAPQHFEVVANGGKGPFMSIDTKGGEPTFAAGAMIPPGMM